MAEKKIVEKFFREAGKVWIQVYGELMPPDMETGEVADPGLWTDGAEKKHLKLLLASLRERAEKKNIEWTEDVMKERLRKFIEASFRDKWISENFMLRMINLNKTKIFNNQITEKNGREKNFGNNGFGKPSTSDSKISALKKWGLSAHSNNGEEQKDL